MIVAFILVICGVLALLAWNRPGLLLPAYAFIYLTVPPYFTVPVGGTGLNLSTQRAAAYLCVCLVLIRATVPPLLGRRSHFLSKSIGLPLALYGLWIAAELFATWHAGLLNAGTLSSIVHIGLYVAVPFLLAKWSLDTKSRQHVLVVFILMAAVIVQVLSFVELKLGHPLLQGVISSVDMTQNASKILQGQIRLGQYRSQGPFSTPLELAQFLCLTIPMAWWLLFGRGQSRSSRLLAAVFFVLLVPAELTTGSRAGVVLTVIAILLQIPRRAFVRGGWIERNALALIGCFIFGCFMLAFGPELITVFETSAGSQGITSIATRVGQYSQGLPLLRKSLIIGYGTGVGDILGHVGLSTIDNFALRVAIESGLLGLLPFLLAIGDTGRRLLRQVAPSFSPRTQRMGYMWLTTWLLAVVYLSADALPAVSMFFLGLLGGIASRSLGDSASFHLHGTPTVLSAP